MAVIGANRPYLCFRKRESGLARRPSKIALVSRVRGIERKLDLIDGLNF
jgi:hypothetical protein